MTAAVIGIAGVAALLALVMAAARLAGVRPAGTESGHIGPRDLIAPGVVLALVLAQLAYDAVAGERDLPRCDRHDPAVELQFVADGNSVRELGRRRLPDGRMVECTPTLSGGSARP